MIPEESTLFVKSVVCGLKVRSIYVLHPTLPYMSLTLGELRGITDAVLNALKGQGISDGESLLEAAKAPSDRKSLASASGVDAKTILELANRADLARIKGIGRVYSDLMEEAGVDTVVELSKRVPQNLHAKLIEINSDVSSRNARHRLNKSPILLNRRKHCPAP